jgi:putative transposase
MLIPIPPKYAVAQAAGYIKGKSAIYIARRFGGRRRSFRGENFWARGYCVTTAGKDEDLIRAYIRNQETEDREYDQRELFD